MTARKKKIQQFSSFASCGVLRFLQPLNLRLQTFNWFDYKRHETYRSISLSADNSLLPSASHTLPLSLAWVAVFSRCQCVLAPPGITSSSSVTPHMTPPNTSSPCLSGCYFKSPFVTWLTGGNRNEINCCDRSRRLTGLCRSSSLTNIPQVCHSNRPTDTPASSERHPGL